MALSLESRAGTAAASPAPDAASTSISYVNTSTVRCSSLDSVATPVPVHVAFALVTWTLVHVHVSPGLQKVEVLLRGYAIHCVSIHPFACFLLSTIPLCSIWSYGCPLHSDLGCFAWNLTLLLALIWFYFCYDFALLLRCFWCVLLYFCFNFVFALLLD